MYVGSKDYVLSLDLHDINREPLIVRASPGVGRGTGGQGAAGLGFRPNLPSEPWNAASHGGSTGWEWAGLTWARRPRFT